MAPSAGTVSAAFTQPPGPNPVGSTVTFNPSSSSSTNPYSSVTWSFGDGGTSFTSGSAPSSVQHTYTAAGVYPVTLTLVDDRGNIAKTSHSLTIGMPPSAAFSFSPPSPVENTSVSFDASGSSDPDSGVHITSYGWNFGDGTSQTVSTPTTNHVFAHYGTYTVTLTVTNSIGLTSTASHQVTVSDELPTAAFTSEVAKPTAGQSIPFDGSASNDPDGSIVSWAWSFGDGGTATGARPTHTYKSAGPYTVTLTVTDSDGETDATSQQLNVIDGPIASFSFAPTQPLQGDAVNFDGSTSTDPTGATITSYSWNFGDGTTGSGKTPIHSYAHYGTYTATLTVTDSNRVSDTAPETIAVSEHPPTASFTVSPANPAAGQPVAFDGTSSSDTDGPIVSYAWSFGDGGTASGANPTHVYATYGTYPVTLTVTDGENQSDSTTQQVTVVADPSPSFTVTAPTALISILTARPVTGQPVRFDGSRSSDPVGPIVSYRWRFGDGSVGGGVRATHSYRKPGDYRVSLTVTDASGQSAITQHLVRVIPAGITHLALRSFQTGATLLVSVNAGGVLFTARRAVRLRHPTTYRLRIDLSAVQLQQLGAGKSVTVRLSLRFAPRSGRASTQRLQIVFKRPAGHKLSATLRR